MKTRNRLMILLGAALFLRLALIVLLKTYEHPVTWEYEIIANNILAGKGFVIPCMGALYKSFNNPLYGYLCAAVYFITNHSYFAVLAIQSIAAILLAFIVFTIAREIFDENTGLIAAAMTCLHPGFLYYDIFSMIPLSIDSLLIALVALCFIKYKDRPTALKMSFTGALIGIGVLSRGIIGALLPFLSGYLLLLPRTTAFKDRVKAIAFIALATFTIIAPWVIRNYIIHKQVMIISTTGETFWRGNNKYAVGTSLTKDGKPVFESTPEEFRRKVYALDEIGQKRFFEKEAFDYIREYPLKFIERYFTKLYYFWWFSPQSGIVYPKMYLTIYRFIYSFAFLGAISGMAMAVFFRGSVIRGNALVLITVFMAICLTQSFFYVEGRHRWLIEPLLFIFLSYAITELYGSLTGRARPVVRVPQKV